MQKEPLINKFCFVLMGFANMFGRYTIISSAKDIIGNQIPNSAIILVNQLPASVIIVLLPFFQEKISSNIKVPLVAIFGIIGYTMVSQYITLGLPLTIFGVAFVSVAYGIGDVTFLSHSSKFSTACLSAWTVGTGFAGILGTGLYAVFAHVMNIQTQLILLMFVPVFLVSFTSFYVSSPRHSPGQEREHVQNVQKHEYEKLETTSDSQSMESIQKPPTQQQKLKQLFKQWYILAYLFFGFMVSNITQNTINSLIEFPGHKKQYFTFAMFAYQLGQFSLKLCVPFVKLPLWCVFIAVLVVMGIFCVIFLQLVQRIIKEFWWCLAIIFAQGVMVGIIYSYSMYWMSKKSQQQFRPFNVSMASFVYACGILVAGGIGIGIQPLLNKYRQ